MIDCVTVNYACVYYYINFHTFMQITFASKSLGLFCSEKLKLWFLFTNHILYGKSSYPQYYETVKVILGYPQS